MPTVVAPQFFIDDLANRDMYGMLDYRVASLVYTAAQIVFFNHK